MRSYMYYICLLAMLEQDRHGSTGEPDLDRAIAEKQKDSWALVTRELQA